MLPIYNSIEKFKPRKQNKVNTIDALMGVALCLLIFVIVALL
jgi:hypothetical protein